jgi:hypothetical protein
MSTYIRMKNMEVTDMGAHSSPRLLIAALLFTVFPATACLANPSPVLPIDLWMGNIGQILAVVAFDFVFDIIVLAVVYLVLRKWSFILTMDFLRHATWVFAAGLAVDFILYGVAGGPVPVSRKLFKYAIVGFLALAAVNYVICTTRPRFSRLQGLAVAAFIGILTNPVIFGWMLKFEDSEPGL